MASVTVRIDGREITAENSQTILQVARANKIHIPTLCYDPRLPPYGSCLVCVVEVRSAGRLLMSCTTPVTEGMDVWTESEPAMKARRAALEMLLSNHYADCRGPCFLECPANVDVQGYLALANAGMYREALNLIRETNPMPLACGRVCVRYCEASCRRNDVDSPAAINFMKRYVADLEYDNLPQPTPVPATGKKVAIIGGGPAGLTCGYYLATKGHQVTILDKQPKLGGMLRYGIPEYRLPEAVLDKEIAYLLAHGIGVKTDVRLGRDFSLDDLTRQGFEAIYLALGSWIAKGMGIENEAHANILPGIAFLEGVKRQGPPRLGGTVAVVGGGNTAIDASRTALRCGAEKVTILYRRTASEMPADEAEVQDARDEGGGDPVPGRAQARGHRQRAAHRPGVLPDGAGRARRQRSAPPRPDQRLGVPLRLRLGDLGDRPGAGPRGAREHHPRADQGQQVEEHRGGPRDVPDERPGGLRRRRRHDRARSGD